jgi:D-Tyr-tRNAtyr deacylase
VKHLLEASAFIDGKATSKIGKGLLTLISVIKNGDKDTLSKIVTKTMNMRLGEAEGKAWWPQLRTLTGR